MKKRTFNEAVAKRIREGEDSFDAIKLVEKSGEFTSEEVEDFWKKFNERSNRKR